MQISIHSASNIPMEGHLKLHWGRRPRLYAQHRAIRCYSCHMKLIAKWLLSATALLAVTYLYSGVEIKSFPAALIAALVIGVFNTILRPILVILTLPVTVLTLGLFLFVINALMFWAAAGILDGFHVRGFGAALLGSLIYSALGLIIDSALQRLFTRQ